MNVGPKAGASPRLQYQEGYYVNGETGGPCQCDLDFHDWLNSIGPSSVLHFGTGLHHYIGINNAERDFPHYIFGLTASPIEAMAYSQLIIEHAWIALSYKTLFCDAYTLNDYSLPYYHIASLFHLCEYEAQQAERDKYGARDDQRLLDRIVHNLKDSTGLNGRLVAWTGSRGWGHAEQLIKQNRHLAHIETYKSLKIYNKV